MAASFCRKFDTSFYQIFRVLSLHKNNSRLTLLGYKQFSISPENADEKLAGNDEFIEERADTPAFSESEEMIENLRNVSRLPPHLRRQLPNSAQLPDMNRPEFNTLYFKRKVYAKFGKASGIDARIMWPTRTEIRQKIEENKILEPSLQERLEKEAERKAFVDKRINQREELIASNMENMSNWIADYKNKANKKLAEQKKQEQKKERLLEEAREHFGYAVDYRDAKFKKMMEEKILEEKKLRKKQQKDKKVQKYLDSSYITQTSKMDEAEKTD